MSRKSIFTVAGGAALGLLIAAGILWGELIAAEAEYAVEQEPDLPPVAEAIRQETPQEAAYTNESTMTVTAHTAPVKNAVERIQTAIQPQERKPHRA